MKTIIERGASWTLDETKLLLTLWGQDQVQRKDTPHKRTKEVYERIASMFNQRGFERTPEQVRTRVFNMIAEYRRILKDPNPEKMKKCIFFNAMHNIYQAQHWSDVKSIVDDYEPDQTYSPASNSKMSEMNDDSVSDGETIGHPDGQNHDSSSMEASNTGSNLNNNNNDTSALKPTSNNDTTAPKSSTNYDTSANAATNNSNSESGTNNNTSATRDNIVNNSITETPAVKKSHAASADKPASSSKKIKLDPLAAGTSQGSVSADTGSNNTEGKQNKSSTSNNVGATSSSAANTSSSSTQPPTQSTSSTLGGKLQSLLAASASSTSSATSTPTASRIAPTGSNSTNSFNSNKSPFVRRPNGGEPINTNGTQPTTTRLQPTAAITSHQLYQAPVNTFDVTSSALLIDRMFAHLSRESENMREWIALEKDRIALEKARRAQEVERESRRERVLIDTLMKFQDQWISYVSRRDPNFKNTPFPRMNIPTDTLLQTTHIDLPAETAGTSTTMASADLPTGASGTGESTSAKTHTPGGTQAAPNPTTPTSTAS